MAFSETGSFKTDRVPSGLNDWLVNTVTAVEEARRSLTVPEPYVKREWDNISTMYLPPPSDSDPCNDVITEIGPLLSTTWGQGCGYNFLLEQQSELGCSGMPCGYAYTGCVATAMAQVMRHHRFPSSYNWSIMPNQSPTFANSSSLEISKLMRDIGSSVDMDYKCGGSGANTKNKVAQSFVNSFGYSSAKFLDYEGTSNYNVVRNEISSNRPVIFRGGNQGNWFIFPVYEDGHAWVCDGFRSHYFCEGGQSVLLLHMNWGWDGTYNGWYNFNNFNPGGYSFNYKSGVVVNIKP